MVNSYSISRRTWKWTKKGFSISSTWQFWTATFSWSLVVPNFHTETSDWHWWEIR
jgi:hypothetical protein